MEGAEPLRLTDSFPCLLDRTATTPLDSHYFYQSLWATERILRESPREHVDVGSETIFVGILSRIVPVSFVDIRRLPIDIPRIRSLRGDLLSLPFPDASVASLSSLHVVEHVGLGRYGDRLAPDGSRRACAELARILAPAGNLFVSLPVGRPRVCFNAHRIHSPAQVLAYFDSLELVEFSLVDDSAKLVIDADIESAADLTYGCGLFWFRRTDVHGSER